MYQSSQARRHTLIGIVIGLLIGAAATGLVWASSGGSSEVRVVARQLDDGRVEVGLQTRPVALESGSEGPDDRAWSEQILPQARFIPADTPANRWLASSSVTIEVEEPTPPNLEEIGPFEISGTPTIARPFDRDTLLCVITHGANSDFFWFQVYSALLDSERWHGIDLRAEMYEESSAQANAIRECVDDGAAAIATTLADADTLKPALDAAAEAGVRIVSFNSGADRAGDSNSIAHVSLDENAVGRVAADEFNQRDVAGDLLCIIHEPSNSGLEQRCDSLEASYTEGSVTRVRINAADDPLDVIRAHSTETVVGALALNANTAYLMADALSASRPDIVLAAVTADFPRPIAMLYSGRLSFVLWSHALEQGYLTTTALLYGHGTPFPRESGMFTGATQITIQPTVITQAAVEQLFDDSELATTLPHWYRALAQAIEDEPAQNDGGQ